MNDCIYNPIENISGPVIAERLQKIFELFPITINETIAPLHPNLWGEDAVYEIEGLQELPPKCKTLSDIVALLSNKNPSKNNELGWRITLRLLNGGKILTQTDLAQP